MFVFGKIKLHYWLFYCVFIISVAESLTFNGCFAQDSVLSYPITIDCIQNEKLEKIGIIFDCDGTLIDSEYYHFLSWQEALLKRGCDLTEEEYFLLSGKSAIYISEKLFEKAKVDSAEMICEDKKEAYRRLQKNGIPSIDRTIKFVHQLAKYKEELGIKLGLASAGYKDEIMINLDHLGLIDVFDVIISGMDDLNHFQDPEGVNKPKPYIYLHTARLLGLDPSQCVVFEDSANGLLASVRAGMITFAVPNNFTKHHDFSSAIAIIEPTNDIDLCEFFKTINNVMVKRRKSIKEEAFRGYLKFR